MGSANPGVPWLNTLKSLPEERVKPAVLKNKLPVLHLEEHSTNSFCKPQDSDNFCFLDLPCTCSLRASFSDNLAKVEGFDLWHTWVSHAPSDECHRLTRCAGRWPDRIARPGCQNETGSAWGFWANVLLGNCGKYGLRRKLSGLSAGQAERVGQTDCGYVRASVTSVGCLVGYLSQGHGYTLPSPESALPSYQCAGMREDTPCAACRERSNCRCLHHLIP